MLTFKEFFTESIDINLWLDDLRPMKPEYNMHVKTAQEAITVLQSGKVKSISFDHDLGPEEAGTGYDVAKWIEEAAFNQQIPKIDWQVHSANPIGAKNIEQAMTSADRYWEQHIPIQRKSIWLDADGKVAYVHGGRTYGNTLPLSDFKEVKDLLSGTVTLKNGTVFRAPFKRKT